MVSPCANPEIALAVNRIARAFLFFKYSSFIFVKI
jgi:hypothetical protein